MPRCRSNAFVCVALLTAAWIAPAAALAQQRMLHVVSEDGQPVAFANVTLAGERPKISNEKGDVELGTSAVAAIKVDVRRLGFEPWNGTIPMGDSVTTAVVTLRRLARRMFTVKITDTVDAVPSYLRGFYERMLARQRGIGSGIYLTPEEVDRRNANIASSLLQGLNGVSLSRTATGKIVAMGAGGTCPMTVLVDGRRVCPDNGCDGGSPSPPPAAPTGGGARRGGRASASTPAPSDARFVLLDNAIGVNEVAAIEVYPRGASIPPSLPAVDASCGLVAYWTGGRPAP